MEFLCYCLGILILSVAFCVMVFMIAAIVDATKYR